MKNNYSSLGNRFRYTPDQLADMCVRYSHGQSFEQIARLYCTTPIAIEGHIMKHYVGIIPKEMQERVTLNSKVNDPEKEII